MIYRFFQKTSLDHVVMPPAWYVFVEASSPGEAIAKAEQLGVEGEPFWEGPVESENRIIPLDPILQYYAEWAGLPLEIRI